MAPTKRNGPAKNKFGTFKEDGAVTVYRKDKKFQDQSTKNTQRQGYSKEVGKETSKIFDGIKNSAMAKTIKHYKKDGSLENADFVHRSRKGREDDLKLDTMGAKPSKGYPDKPFLKHTTKGKS